MELLRLSRAAKRLGVHPVTLRLWADSGKIPVTWVGRERRFSSVDVESMKVTSSADRAHLEALYVRVSGSSGQESSLDAQEKELRSTSSGEIVRVFKDRSSGLREDRLGLNRLVQLVDELLEDFVSLVTTFAGRLYGMRSAETRMRLLADSGQCLAEACS